MAEYLSMLQGIVSIIALIIGSYVALVGLTTWKRQIAGQAEYDLVRRVLTSAAKVEDMMAYTRVRGDEDYAEQHEAELVKELKQKQLDALDGALEELDGVTIEADAFWEEADFPIELFTIHAMGSQLKVAIQMYYFNPNLSAEERRKYDAIVFGKVPGSGEVDEFGWQLQRLIGSVKKRLRPKLRTKRS